jgi:hypothetical protein
VNPLVVVLAAKPTGIVFSIASEATAVDRLFVPWLLFARRPWNSRWLWRGRISLAFLTPFCASFFGPTLLLKLSAKLGIYLNVDIRVPEIRMDIWPPILYPKIPVPKTEVIGLVVAGPIPATQDITRFFQEWPLRLRTIITVIKRIENVKIMSFPLTGLSFFRIMQARGRAAR